MKKIAIILTLIIILSVSVSAVWWNPATWFENSQEPPFKVFAPNELAYLEIKESACGKTELSPEDVILAGHLPGGKPKPAGFDFPTKPPKATEQVEQFLASCTQLGQNPKDQDMILAYESFTPKGGWAAWYHAMKGSYAYVHDITVSSEERDMLPRGSLVTNKPENDEGKEINKPEVKENLIARCKEVANDPTLANAKDIKDWLDQQSSDAIIVKSQQEHAERRSSIASKGNIWPPYNDPDSEWPWNKFIPQNQNPCKEISNEKVIVTSDNVKIGDKEYSTEKVELTILRPGFLAAKVELPGKPGGPATYPTGPSLRARNDRPIYIPPRGIIKETPDIESNGNGWVEGELAQRAWYGPDADSAIQPKAKQNTNLDESVLAGYLPGGKKQTPGFDTPNKPPKAQEDQSQQLASVIPGRETITPPLTAKPWSKEGGWFLGDDDFLTIIIPGGPHTDEPQRLCTKNVELNVKPGVPPSIPPYPGSPPTSPRSQKYEEINPQDFIKLQISRNACDKGEIVADGIISIPKEEVKLAMINVPGMPRPITNLARHVGSGTVWIQNPRPHTYTARKDMPGYKPPTGPRRQAVPAQLPPAPKLPELPKTELDDKDCCIKCQPVFQTRTVSINDQCPEGFYKRIFEGCDKHEVKYLQSFCPKKEQTKQISTKNPVPTMPPTVPERPKLS